jgi:hypothetical protein
MYEEPNKVGSEGIEDVCGENRYIPPATGAIHN